MQNFIRFFGFLMLGSILLPATVQYSAAFWVLVYYSLLGLGIIKSQQPNSYVPSFRDLLKEPLNKTLCIFSLCAASLIIFSQLMHLAWHNDALFDGWVLQEAKAILHFVLKSYVFPVVVIFLVQILHRDGKGLNYFRRAYLVWTAVYLMYLLLQSIYGVDWIRGFGSMLIPERLMVGGNYRLSGFMSHPLSFSFNVLLLFMLFWSLQLIKSRIFVIKSQQFLFFVTAYAGVLLLSGSRIAVLCVVVFAAFILVRRGVLKNFGLIAVSSIGLILFLLYERSLWSRFLELKNFNALDTQSFARIGFWRIHLNIFRDYPLFGTGLWNADSVRLEYYKLAGYNSNNEIYNAHNIFLQNMADFGIFGVLSLLVYLGVISKIILKSFCQGEKYLGFAFCTNLILMGLFQNHLRDSEFNYALAYCVGTLIALNSNYLTGRVWYEQHNADRKPTTDRETSAYREDPFKDLSIKPSGIDKD